MGIAGRLVAASAIGLIWAAWGRVVAEAGRDRRRWAAKMDEMANSGSATTERFAAGGVERYETGTRGGSGYNETTWSVPG
jgi:hypothetical protein